MGSKSTASYRYVEFQVYLLEQGKRKKKSVCLCVCVHAKAFLAIVVLLMDENRVMRTWIENKHKTDIKTWAIN